MRARPRGAARGGLAAPGLSVALERRGSARRPRTCAPPRVRRGVRYGRRRDPSMVRRGPDVAPPLVPRRDPWTTPGAAVRSRRTRHPCLRRPMVRSPALVSEARWLRLFGRTTGSARQRRSPAPRRCRTPARSRGCRSRGCRPPRTTGHRDPAPPPAGLRSEVPWSGPGVLVDELADEVSRAGLVVRGPAPEEIDVLAQADPMVNGAEARLAREVDQRPMAPVGREKLWVAMDGDAGLEVLEAPQDARSRSGPPRRRAPPPPRGRWWRRRGDRSRLRRPWPCGPARRRRHGSRRRPRGPAGFAHAPRPWPLPRRSDARAVDLGPEVGSKATRSMHGGVREHRARREGRDLVRLHAPCWTRRTEEEPVHEGAAGRGGE